MVDDKKRKGILKAKAVAKTSDNIPVRLMNVNNYSVTLKNVFSRLSKRNFLNAWKILLILPVGNLMASSDKKIEI